MLRLREAFQSTPLCEPHPPSTTLTVDGRSRAHPATRRGRKTPTAKPDTTLTKVYTEAKKNSGSIPTVSRDHPGCGNSRLAPNPNKAQPKCQSVSAGKGAKVEIGRMQCPLMRSPRAATSPLQVKTRQITGQIGLTKVYDCVSFRDDSKQEAQCQRSISANGCPHRARCASIVR